MAVNQERVTLLVEALESGAYEQCHGKLRIGDQFCCLGVACDVAIKNGLDIVVNSGGATWSGDPCYDYDGEEAVLPESVRVWYGFPSVNVADGPPGNPGIDIDGTKMLAAVANDEYELSFAKIAAGFRKEYLTPA